MALIYGIILSMTNAQQSLMYFAASESWRRKSKEEIEEERTPKGFIAKHPALSLFILAVWIYAVVKIALLLNA